MAAKALEAWLSTDRDAVALLDVREPWEYDVCRIPGSRLIPLSQLAARLVEIEPGRPTVVICHHGIRSLRAAAFLEHCGFEDVVNLNGGIDAWARTVDSAMAVY